MIFGPTKANHLIIGLFQKLFVALMLRKLIFRGHPLLNFHLTPPYPVEISLSSI